MVRASIALDRLDAVSAHQQKEEFVYLAYDSAARVWKIGVSWHPSKRVAAVSSLFGYRLKHIATFSGGREAEKALHCMFSRFALGREFFSDNKEIWALLDVFRAQLAVA